MTVNTVIHSVTALSNGNYVINSPSWNGKRGAVTWGSGTTGVSGTVSSSNSLVGSSANDGIGSGDVTALSDGNYVVVSDGWSSNRGAVTWGNGTIGISGTVSSSNSLVGSAVGDEVGYGVQINYVDYGAIALSNGNYLVISPFWSGGRGAVTWGSETLGVRGTISSGNSLVGSTASDEVGSNVTALTNGNYVVQSIYWNGDRGAATWGNGLSGVDGAISSANSLIGTSTYDEVGYSVTVLTNGNYVVGSPSWNGNRGAATWGNGLSGVNGTISSANSLVGSSANDGVGNSVTALTNGNYVVGSQSWTGARGAATWESGSSAASGTISSRQQPGWLLRQRRSRL